MFQMRNCTLAKTEYKGLMRCYFQAMMATLPYQEQEEQWQRPALLGKSTRRSRSRTGTPAAKREDPTLAAADMIFSQFLAQKPADTAEVSQRKSSVSSSIPQPNLSAVAPLSQIDGNGSSSSRFSMKEAHKEPTEVILRGFRSNQQFAAIREYERIGGRICEDYSRDPPVEQRKYKADLRDQASLRRRPMTVEEKSKALRFAGGEHWIKVTFESAEAAEVAVESSPQTILGYLVYAELYRGVPPSADEAVPVGGKQRASTATQSLGVASGFDAQPRRPSSTLPRSFTTPAMREVGRGASSLSPSDSLSSSQTIDSATVASTTSSATAIGAQPSSSQNGGEQLFCRKIPSAKRVKLLPAEEALLPQQSFWKRLIIAIPLISWLSADIIGNTVPRKDNGEFDWDKASLYWKIIWFLDSLFGWFGVCNGDD